jgi:2'-5' RNA ligase
VVEIVGRPAGRVFAAVPLPHEIKLALVDRVNGLDIPGKVVPPENWHITLRFLGSVDQVAYERFLAALAEVEMPMPFSIRLAGLGGFPNPRKATVVWAGVTDNSGFLGELNEITENAAQSAGLGPEERPFHPHVTLARVRPEKDITQLVEQHVDLEWRADQLVIFRSILGQGGAKYEVLERFGFSPAKN